MKDDKASRKRLGEKFAAARTIIGLSKGDAAKPCGLLPRDIAQVEDGTKRFIPTPYLQFLSKWVDLNSLFDDHAEVRLRPSEVPVPRIPAVDTIQEINERLQAVAGPPAWLKPLLELQERIAAVEAAQKGAAPDKKGKAG